VGQTGGHALLLEEGLDGQLLDRRMVRSDPGRWIGAAATWLQALPRLEASVKRPASALLQLAFEVIRRTCVDPDVAALAERSRRLVGTWDDGALESVTEHGDLSHPNLIVRPDGALAALDWELARPDGLPLHDLCTFLDYVAVATSGDELDPFGAFTSVLSNPAWGAVARLRDEADRWRLGDGDTLSRLVIITWVRMFAGVASRLFDGGAAAPAGWHRRNRYYLLWERSVREQDRLQSLLG
jgi:hypothetical protein